MLMILIFSILWFMCSSSVMMMMAVMGVMMGVMSTLHMNEGFSYSGMMLELDKVGMLLVLLSLWMVVVMIMVSGDVKLANKLYKFFYFLIMMLNLVLMLTFSLSDVIWFFVFFEITMIPTLGLIIGWGYQPERLKAMFYMLIYTVISSLPLLLILLSSSDLKSSSYFYLKEVSGGGVGLLVFIFLVLSMMVKLPVYNFHLWLPKAHVEAPLAGSIVLAAILLKLGGYGIFRFMEMYKYIFIINSDKLMILGFLGAAFSSIVCMRQVDVKSLIAYSSIAHMGVMLAAMSTMSGLGLQGGYLMMISHGFSSSFLFYLAFVNYGIYGSRSAILSSGLLKIYPSLSLMWFMASIMGLGVPPSLNFVAEVNINYSVVLSGVVSTLILTIVLFVGAVYSLYLYTSSSHGLLMGYTKVNLMLNLNYQIVGLLHLFPGFMMVLVLGVFLIWTLI